MNFNAFFVASGTNGQSLFFFFSIENDTKGISPFFLSRSLLNGHHW